jgi:hypothetical protein
MIILYRRSTLINRLNHDKELLELVRTMDELLKRKGGSILDDLDDLSPQGDPLPPPRKREYVAPLMSA